MGRISDAITREYNSALQRHQDSLTDGLKKVVDAFEKNKFVQTSPEKALERRALTEAEEISILRNEITRVLRSATGLASAGFAQKAENERAVVDILMVLIPKKLFEELMSDHLDWESKIKPASNDHGETPRSGLTVKNPRQARTPQMASPRTTNNLSKNFNKRFQELETHQRSGHFLSGEISEVAEKVWRLSQLWMIFLDGVDLGFNIDHELYRDISDLAYS